MLPKDEQDKVLSQKIAQHEAAQAELDAGAWLRELALRILYWRSGTTLLGGSDDGASAVWVRKRGGNGSAGRSHLAA